MTAPKFSMDINLGHVLQVGALLVAVALGWATMEHRTSSNTTAIAAQRDDFEQDMQSLRAEFGAAKARVRAVETNAARADERLQSIYTLLARMDARLARIEDK